MKTNPLLCLLCFILIQTTAFAQTEKKEDPWKALRFFLGTWEGVVDGQSGKGTSIRSYELILNDKYVQVRNTSSYPPQEKNPKGEEHQDLGFISFDRNPGVFILRQFHIEGFVNQYRQESISEDGKRIVFVTEAIENIPAGWKARETYSIQNENEFVETFELAEPGKEYSVYSRASFKRTQP